jgi:UDP-GlcNAc:undecaprenyl-phosphate GlcNAc-1-phosphate transferase
VALALRFVPYSDDRGHFDAVWTVVMAAILLAGVAASFYVIYVLEILKLRRVRLRQVAGLRREATRPAPAGADIDRAVAAELETGSFPAIDPDTGEFPSIDREED